MIKSGGTSAVVSPNGGATASNLSSAGFTASSAFLSSNKFSAQAMTTLPYDQKA